MSLENISISSNIRDYEVEFSLSNAFIGRLADISPSLFVVDENVWALHKNTTLKAIKTRDNVVVLPISENAKTLSSVTKLYDSLTKKSSKRNMTLITIGGGIAQDISGFVASTIYRGIKWIYVPTTLLAQADSCIGAKTSLNYKQFKNLIGTFYPPTRVIVHPAFLKTLKNIDYFSGVGEIAKLHLMGGKKDTEAFINSIPAIRNRHEKTMISLTRRSLLIKKGYIEGDEFDLGRRNMLNFGHCFGHAIESATEFKVPHGQAVTLGIILANIVASKKGLLTSFKENDMRNRMLLPIIDASVLKQKLNNRSIIEAMKQDKKRTGEGLPLVMMKNDHSMVRITDLELAEADSALNRLRSLLDSI